MRFFILMKIELIGISYTNFFVPLKMTFDRTYGAICFDEYVCISKKNSLKALICNLAAITE